MTFAKPLRRLRLKIISQSPKYAAELSSAKMAAIQRDLCREELPRAVLPDLAATNG